MKRLDLGLYNALKWSELLLIILYVSQVLKTQVQFLTVFWITFLAAVFQSILGLIQFHVQHSLGLGFLGEYIAPLGTSGLATIQVGSQKLIRAYGTMPHPNILGAFLVFGLISGLFIVSHATKRQKSLISVGLLIIMLGLFASFSRLAWVGGTIATISFLFYYLKVNRRELMALILVPVIVSCATILILMPNTLKARVSDTNSASITDRAFFDRLGLELFSHHPLFGVGVGNYIPALEAANKLDAWQYQPAHNIFIFIAAELGILGLGLFILILFEIFSRLKNVSWETLTFTFAVLGILFLFMSLFDHYFVTIQQGRLMFFTVLGLIAALPNIYAQKPD
ncbi:MAG: O-antigen ligase family protein [Candidatus Doudnabacteria bacterium]